MSFTAQQIYELLPAIYRTRDARNGGQLQALLGIIATQAGVLQDNIDQLYEDQFIETCASWVVPYIADLIGCDAIYEVDAAPVGRRAEVANTIGYRRRKGTLIDLEQVCMDISGMPTLGVEFFRRLITTQSMRHLRPQNASTLNLRRGLQLSKLNSPFDTINRTIDVRRIAPPQRKRLDPDPTPLQINLHGGGRFNIPDVGIYLWRWKAHPMTNAPAFVVGAGRYMFNPLGQNMPLFNKPQPRDSFSRLTTNLDVPRPIHRREFFDSITAFYGPNFQLIADGVPIDPSQICCRDLSDSAGPQWGCTAAGKIAIDPELGRIQFAADVPLPTQLRVSYIYGSSADIGGGTYDRSASLSNLNLETAGFVAQVGTTQTPTIESAVTAWNQQPDGTVGVILLPNCETFDCSLTSLNAITLATRSRLWIVAAQTHSASGNTSYTFNNSFVTLRGNIEIHSTAASGSEESALLAGQLTFSGLRIAGNIQATGAAINLQLMDCTLVPGIGVFPDGSPTQPGEPGIIMASTEPALSLTRCISGPISIGEAASTVRICSSIIDSTCPCNVAYAGEDLASMGADLHIEDSTVIGKIYVRTMQLASNTLFIARRPKHDPWKAALWCARQQAGCMRFCFIPNDSLTPKRFHCMPDVPANQPALEPRFISLEYGDPSYGMLSDHVPMAIWTGADDGGQMGACHSLQQTQAVRNVQLRAPQYVPFGFEAGIFLVPSKPERPRHQQYSYGYGYGQQPRARCCDESQTDELAFIGIGAHLL
ncbi:MAG TPA: hypothetical protein VHS31_19425 [Tepidisphaeraceae bacterium]|jgi:hypothetical protein|nr:hypothetical protein [Tepidisphaeraceae bacterium]